MKKTEAYELAQQVVGLPVRTGHNWEVSVPYDINDPNGPSTAYRMPNNWSATRFHRAVLVAAYATYYALGLRVYDWPDVLWVAFYEAERLDCGGRTYNMYRRIRCACLGKLRKKGER